ncbi:MAG: tetratricopeptide repeat protein [Candidatus Omnitrophica bacterium]|nr:tetratricopeptide repeat protein [Candidatus Omnitrophota bacterium]
MRKIAKKYPVIIVLCNIFLGFSFSVKAGSLEGFSGIKLDMAADSFPVGRLNRARDILDPEIAVFKQELLNFSEFHLKTVFKEQGYSEEKISEISDSFQELLSLIASRVDIAEIKNRLGSSDIEIVNDACLELMSILGDLGYLRSVKPKALITDITYGIRGGQEFIGFLEDSEVYSKQQISNRFVRCVSKTFLGTLLFDFLGIEVESAYLNLHSFIAMQIGSEILLIDFDGRRTDVINTYNYETRGNFLVLKRLLDENGLSTAKVPGLSYPFIYLGNRSMITAFLNYNMGQAYRWAGCLDKAEEHFHRAIECNPECAESYYGLGRIYGELQDFKKAELYYQQAVDKSPWNFLFYAGLGHALCKLNQYHRGLEAFMEAVSLNPKFARGYFAIGTIYQRLGRQDEAIFYWAKAVSLDFHLFSLLSSFDIKAYVIEQMLKSPEPASFSG